MLSRRLEACAEPCRSGSVLRSLEGSKPVLSASKGGERDSGLPKNMSPYLSVRLLGAVRQLASEWAALDARRPRR